MRGGAGGSLRGQSSTAPGEEAGLGQSRRGARAGMPAPGGGWAGAVPRWLRAAGAPPGRPMSPPASTPRRKAIDFAALIDRFSLAQGRRGTSDRHRKDIGARAGGTGPPLAGHRHGGGARGVSPSSRQGAPLPRCGGSSPAPGPSAARPRHRKYPEYRYPCPPAGRPRSAACPSARLTRPGPSTAAP